MGVERFYGELMLEPMCLRPWEIAEMTDEQLLMPLAAAARRNRQTSGEPEPFDPENQSDDEQFHHMRRLGLTLGYSPEQIVRQWNELHPDNQMPIPSHHPSQQPSPTQIGRVDPTKPAKRSLFAAKGGE